MRLWPLILGLLLASSVGAQTVKVQLTDGTRKWYEPLPVPHRTADTAWWASSLASDALSVADVENSIRAEGDCRNTREINPIFGRCPGRGRYYGTILPVALAGNYLSWRYKREDDALKASGYQGHRFVKWHLPNDLNLAAHAAGVLVTLLSTRR